MELPTLAEIQQAQSVVYRHMPPTPQYTWPLVNARLSAGNAHGVEAWIKHENHTPVGAFKLRGALVYADWLSATHPDLNGVVAATRGNHGQGVGMAARLLGLKAVIVVPHGNSKEKNRAMLAQGVELIEHGHDFQESLEFARDAGRRARLRDGRLVSRAAGDGHGDLCDGILSGQRRRSMCVYVPIGLGSSICGVSAARNALGLKTEIVGVVAAAVAFVRAQL